MSQDKIAEAVESLDKDMEKIERLTPQIQAMMRPKVEALIRPRVVAGLRPPQQDNDLEEEGNTTIYMTPGERKDYDARSAAYEALCAKGLTQGNPPALDQVEHQVEWAVAQDALRLFNAWDTLCVWYSPESDGTLLPDLKVGLGDDLLPASTPARDKVWREQIWFTYLTADEAREILRELRQEAGDILPQPMAEWLDRYRPPAA